MNDLRGEQKVQYHEWLKEIDADPQQSALVNAVVTLFSTSTVISMLFPYIMFHKSC